MNVPCSQGGIGSWDCILMPWGAFLCACPPAGTKVDSFRETEKSKPHFLFRVGIYILLLMNAYARTFI